LVLGWQGGCGIAVLRAGREDVVCACVVSSMTARGVVGAVVSKKWWLADVQGCINSANMARKKPILSVLGHASDARRTIRGRSKQDGH
jgi:hypothetical protein